MKNFILLILLIFGFNFSSYSQERTETNTDILLQRAQELYQNGDFSRSLDYTRRGLELAPQYHDIRILEIRNLWALERILEADEDLEYLTRNAADYPGVEALVFKRISMFRVKKEALEYAENYVENYPANPRFRLKYLQLLLQDGQKGKVRELAKQVLKSNELSGEERYNLQMLLKRSVSDEVGLSYENIAFSDDYSHNNSWHALIAEYQHLFNRTAVIGRTNYSDRGYSNGSLYELEAYPVFSDKFYAFTNLGISDGNIFPDVRSSLSLYYNFAKIFEAEAGARMLFLNDSSFFTGILGLSLYRGKFYLNLRTFLGPERREQLAQNYQFNLRYYLKEADNYLFIRLGSGISPDEPNIYTQVLDNPGLEAYYGNLGIKKSIGIHHVFQLGFGMLFEEINSETTGTQYISNIGYGYRF